MNSTARPQSSLYAKLTYAGAVPFAACAASSAVGGRLPAELPDVHAIALGYGLMIVSFMAGTVWGQQIHRLPEGRVLLLASVTIALIAWCAFTVAAPPLIYLIDAGLFAALLLLDWRGDRVPGFYLKTRLAVTVIVVVCLLILSATYDR